MITLIEMNTMQMMVAVAQSLMVFAVICIAETWET